MILGLTRVSESDMVFLNPKGGKSSLENIVVSGYVSMTRHSFDVVEEAEK